MNYYLLLISLRQFSATKLIREPDFSGLHRRQYSDIITGHEKINEKDVSLEVISSKNNSILIVLVSNISIK